MNDRYAEGFLDGWAAAAETLRTRFTMTPRAATAEAARATVSPAAPDLYPSAFWAHRMRDVMDAARNHQCRPILGPKPLPPGTTIEGVGAQMQAYVELPAVSHHRTEVWL